MKNLRFPSLREPEISVLQFIDKPADIFQGSHDIFCLLLAADFAFDDEFPLEAEFMEFRNDFLEIDFAFPDRNFVTELVSVNRIYAVFHMQIADIFPEYIEGVERIAFPVKNDVCRIKVDPEVRQGKILNCAQKREGVS